MTIDFALPALEDDRNRARGTMASRVFDSVRQAIVQLKFHPGNPLSEAEIGRQLGVSRQPVREAFIKLAEAGLVEIRPQRGTFVRLISRREVENARFLREAIEVAIARKAALEASGDDIAAVLGIVSDQKTVAATGDNAAFMSLDEQFHQAIARSADCVDAWRVIEGLKAQMDRVRYLSLPQATPFDVVIAQHERIAEAVAAHDPERAEQAMHLHLTEILISLPKLALENPAYFAP
jgi:DNA-binding GntR family transcriptional regulator